VVVPIIYVLSILQTLDAKTGDPLEPTRTILAQLATGSPMIANGVIYDCSDDGNLYTFDLETKAKLWSTTVFPSGYIFTTFPPTPVVANGTVYINPNGQLLAFRLQS
jgi:outer membrane protein assembly factor BamB